MSTVSTAALTTETSAERASMDDFLASVERRAFRMAQVSTGDRESALDIVQDSMMKLVQHYSDRTVAEWRPLFFRILNNRINDWHRRQNSRWAIFDRWFGTGDEQEGDAMDLLPGSSREQPDRQLAAQLTLNEIDTAIRSLSARQQQAFMLRCWEGMSTQETAAAMACSEGTVKTLYSRAMAGLRLQLQESSGR